MSTERIYKFLSNSAPVIAILAVCLLLFMPWWKEGKVCAPLDIVTNLYEPWADSTKPVNVHNHNSTDNVEHYLLYRYFVQRSLQEEGRVGWNPLKGGGTAEYANTMAAPGSLIYVFYRFLPFWDAWNLGLLVEYMLAMLGMYVFLRYQKYDRGLCLIGGLAYGLNTHFAAWIFHRWALGGFCWTPWYLWALLGIRQKKPFGVLAPAFIAASFFGGHMQYAAFQVLVCAAFMMGWYCDEYVATKKFGGRPFASMAVIGILSVLLACIMFIPCAYAFHITMQAGLVRGGLGYPDGFLAVIKRIIAYPTYIFPALYGGPGLYDMGRILSTNILAIPFFGSLLVIFAFAGLFIRQLNATAKIIICLGLLLPTTPLVGPLYQRLLMLFVLGGVWLAVDLIARCPDKTYGIITKTAKIPFILVVVAVLAIGLIVTIKHDAVSAILRQQILPSIASHRFAGRPDWFVGRIEKLIHGYEIWNPRIWIPLLGFGVSVFLMPYRRRGFFGPIVSLCILGQLWIPHKEWMTFVTPPDNDKNQIYPATEETRAIQAAVGPAGRVVVAQTKGRLPLFPPNSLTYFGVQSINVYDSILPNGMEPHNNYSPDIQDLPSAAFFGKIGTTHLVTFKDIKPQDSGWVPQRTVGDISIYSNVWARARYTLATTTGASLSLSPVISQRNYRKLEIPKDSQALSVCENQEQGWKYRIGNEKWRPMLRAEDGSMFATIKPPSTATTFELLYDPLARKIGRTVSLLSLALYLIFAVFYVKNTRTALQKPRSV